MKKNMNETKGRAPISVGLDHEGHTLLQLSDSSGVAITATLTAEGAAGVIRLLAATISETHEVTVSEKNPSSAIQD